jgi:predicted ATPase
VGRARNASNSRRTAEFHRRDGRGPKQSSHGANVARRQKAKLWELRAAKSLASLWCDQDKCTEGHDLLASIYGRFTEGFNTPDLKEAKALLDELA